MHNDWFPDWFKSPEWNFIHDWYLKIRFAYPLYIFILKYCLKDRFTQEVELIWDLPVTWITPMSYMETLFKIIILVCFVVV